MNQPFSKIWIAVMLILLVVGGIFAWQYFGTQKEEVQAPRVTKDETASWQTYRNEEFGFEVRYPEEFAIDDEGLGLTIIYKKDTKLELPPDSIIDPYGVALAIYNRKTESVKSASNACARELCMNLENVIVGHLWRKDQVQINNAYGLKVWSIDRVYQADYYLSNSDGSRIVRIIYGAEFIDNENRRLTDFTQLNQILSTFRFVE